MNTKNKKYVMIFNCSMLTKCYDRDSLVRNNSHSDNRRSKCIITLQLTHNMSFRFIKSICRFVPVKLRTKWSQLLASILDGCAKTPDERNWQKLFSVSKCILRASHRGGKKHERNQDQRLSDRIDRWNAGEYANLWTEAFSIKAKKNSTNRIEELASRAKSMFARSIWSRRKNPVI